AAQRQPPEAPLAEDVCKGLARRTPFHERLDRTFVEIVVQTGELRARHARDVRHDPFRVGARRRYAAPGEDRGRPLDDHSSARRRSSACNASVKSSRSPSTIWSSLCSVSLIRWSVTRFSGKLYVRIFSARSPEPICDRLCAASSACCLSRSSS